MGNLFLILTSAGEFHQRSHLALKEASTCVVATFWSYSICHICDEEGGKMTVNLQHRRV